MSVSKDRDLDELLRRWAAAQAASNDKLQALEQRVLDRLADYRAADEANVPASRLDFPPRGIPLRRRVAIVVATAAAVMLASWLVLRDQISEPSEIDEFAATELMPRDPRHDRRLLSELQRVFDQRVAWIAEGAEKISVGVAPANAPDRRAPTEFVAVRLALVARSTASEPWKLLDTLQVISGMEETIELVQDSAAAPDMFLWAYPLGKGMVSIDFDGWQAGPDGTAIASSTIQRLGELTTVETFSKDGVEYRVLQLAEAVENNDLS